MDAASEVVNALSELYWEVETALAAGGPYRFRNGNGSTTGVISTIVGGFYRPLGPDYRARIRQIRDAFSELDALLGDLFVFTAPLLRIENRGRLEADVLLLAEIVNRIDEINELLALPVPTDHSAPSNRLSQAAPDFDSSDWSSLSPSLQRSLAASADLATPMFTDPNSSHNLSVIAALRSIREARHSEAVDAEEN
jgi:hypothetical protein